MAVVTLEIVRQRIISLPLSSNVLDCIQINLSPLRFVSHQPIGMHSTFPYRRFPGLLIYRMEFTNIQILVPSRQSYEG